MQDFYDRKPTCSVTEHKVIEVANSKPELFLDPEGNINIPRVLFYLGFDIRKGKDVHNQNYTVHEDFCIRHSKDNLKCYKTTVYAGDIRNAAKVVDGKPVQDENGNPVLDKNRLHHMSVVYEGGAVLQPDDLDKYVTPDMLINISDLGGKRSG